MVESYLKSTEVASVEPLRGSPIEFVVTLKDGRTANVDFVESFRPIRRDKESDLERANKAMQFFADRLHGSGIVLIWRGRHVSFGGPELADIIGALLSSEDPEVRLENLEKAGFMSRNAKPAQVLAAEFEPSEQLSARYEAMKAVEEYARSVEAVERSISEMAGKSPAAGAEQDGGRGWMIAGAAAVLLICVGVGIGLLRGKRAPRAKG